MQCPLCKETALVMTERQNIEIDYCRAVACGWIVANSIKSLSAVNGKVPTYRLRKLR